MSASKPEAVREGIELLLRALPPVSRRSPPRAVACVRCAASHWLGRLLASSLAGLIQEDGDQRDYVFFVAQGAALAGVGVWLLLADLVGAARGSITCVLNPPPAPGYYALGDYDRASKWNELLLRREPNNQQFINLQQQIADALDRGADARRSVWPGDLPASALIHSHAVMALPPPPALDTKNTAIGVAAVAGAVALTGFFVSRVLRR